MRNEGHSMSEEKNNHEIEEVKQEDRYWIMEHTLIMRFRECMV